MTSWLTSGLPRQLRLMKQNSRCSILFHLLVPGGKWQTRDLQPGVVGEALQLVTFHSRVRLPLLSRRSRR